MSGISGVGTAGPQTVPVAVVLQSSGATTSPPQAASGDAAQPAVVVSLSSGATASLQATSTMPSLDPDQVDNALSWIAGANGFADIAAHYDSSMEVVKFGEAIVDRNKASALGAAADSASNALSNGSGLGIPIQDSVSPGAVQSGAAPGTISVGAFSFTSGGSIYSVAPGANGMLVGTKDGQAWKTWQLTDPADAADSGSGASVALQILTAPKTSADKPSGVDISA